MVLPDTEPHAITAHSLQPHSAPPAARASPPYHASTPQICSTTRPIHIIICSFIAYVLPAPYLPTTSPSVFPSIPPSKHPHDHEHPSSLIQPSSPQRTASDTTPGKSRSRPQHPAERYSTTSPASSCSRPCCGGPLLSPRCTCFRVSPPSLFHLPTSPILPERSDGPHFRPLSSRPPPSPPWTSVRSGRRGSGPAAWIRTPARP